MYQLSALQGENQLTSSDLNQQNIRGKIQAFIAQNPVNQGELLQQNSFQLSFPMQLSMGNQLGPRGGGSSISDISNPTTIGIRNSTEYNQHSSHSISTTYSLKNESNFNGRDTGALQGRNDFLLGMDESARYAKDTGEEEQDDDVSNESVAERKILKIDRRLSKHRQQIDKTQKRRLQNRKSALKCRLRKSHLIVALQHEVALIKSEKQSLLKEVLQLRDRVKEEQLTNSALLVELTKLQVNTKGQQNQIQSHAQSQAHIGITQGNPLNQQAYPLVIHQNHHIGHIQLPVQQMSQADNTSSNASQTTNSTFIIDQPNMAFNKDYNIMNMSSSAPLQQQTIIGQPNQQYVQTMNQIKHNPALGVTSHLQGAPIHVNGNTIITTGPIIGVHQQGTSQGFFQQPHGQQNQGQLTLSLTHQQSHQAQPQQVIHQQSAVSAGLKNFQAAPLTSLQQHQVPSHHQVLGLQQQQQQQYLTYIPQQMQSQNAPQAIGNIQQPMQYGQNSSLITQANGMTGQVGNGAFNLQNQTGAAYSASLGQGKFIPATQLFVQQQTGRNYGK